MVWRISERKSLKCARFVPENMGRFTENVLRERNGLYKTVMHCRVPALLEDRRNWQQVL
jgi:hypothetical protein